MGGGSAVTEGRLDEDSDADGFASGAGREELQAVARITAARIVARNTLMCGDTQFRPGRFGYAVPARCSVTAMGIDGFERLIFANASSTASRAGRSTAMSGVGGSYR